MAEAHPGRRLRAERLAPALALLPGILGTLVCRRDGSLLASAHLPDPAKQARLVALVARRAASVIAETDLRGMGKEIHASRLAEAVVSSADGDLAILVDGDLLVGAALIPGRGGELVLPALRNALRNT